LRPRDLVRWLAYLLGLFLFLEGASRGLLASGFVFEKIAGDDEASWRLRWIRQPSHRSGISYSFDIYHPLRGWALKPGLKNRSFFGDKRLNSNDRGLRGNREYPYKRISSFSRIVVLGDSFTFGEEVSDEETFCSYLSERLGQTEVLNLGVHGYGHDQMLLYLEEEGLKYRPDLVILGFVTGGMRRNVLGFRDYAKPRYSLVGGHLVLGKTPVPPPELTLRAEIFRSKFLDLWGMLADRIFVGRREEQERTLTIALLDAMSRAIRAHGARPVFAYLPVYDEIRDTSADPTPGERFLFDYCGSRDVLTLSVRASFAAELARGVTLKSRGHWSPKEHALAASGLASFLEERGLLK